MPIFKPRSFEESDYDESIVESALVETGLGHYIEADGPPDEKIDVLAPQSLDPKEETEFRKILNKSGASVSNASRTIAQIMNHSKMENTRLRAAEMVLDLQGVRDKEGKLTKQAVFNFIINDSNVNIQNIFGPVRTTTSLSEELSD